MPVGWLKELMPGEYVIIRMRSVKHEIDMLAPCLVAQNTPEFLVVNEAGGERVFRFDSRNALTEVFATDEAENDRITYSLSIHKADSDTAALVEGSKVARERYESLVEQLDPARDVHVSASLMLHRNMVNCLKKEECERKMQ